MKLPDELGFGLPNQATTFVFTSAEIEKIVRHCAKVCRRPDQFRANQAQMEDAILKEFGLE
jgi:hypothetical protein